MRRPPALPKQLLSQPFTIAQARACGLTRRRTRAKDLNAPSHGVRVPAAIEITLLVRARSLADATGAIVSHLTAAALWGFPLPLCFEAHALIHLTRLPGGRAVRRKDVAGHELALRADEITEGRYVTCTSPLRTWFDLAAVLSLDEQVIAGDFLVRRRNPLSTLGALDEFLATRAGKPGYRKVMAARALVRPDTDSPKETELRLLLLKHGLPEPSINEPMFDDTGGWIQDPDMSYELLKIAIQYDGGHHATPVQRRSDIFRDENARDLGWLVVVLTQWDLDPFAPGMEPNAVTRVRTALRDRGWSPAT